MPDLGLTHVALPVSDVDRSLDFYSKYASMQLVHRRCMDDDTEKEIVWISDLTRPFVIVLAEVAVEQTLGPFAHLGVACQSAEDVDRFANMAKQEGCLAFGPAELGPAGYLISLRDPDGHTLELSHGQDVNLAVEQMAERLRRGKD